jgi:methionine salvage enolase-phosphatase E1
VPVEQVCAKNVFSHLVGSLDLSGKFNNWGTRLGTKRSCTGSKTATIQECPGCSALDILCVSINPEELASAGWPVQGFAHLKNATASVRLS